MQDQILQQIKSVRKKVADRRIELSQATGARDTLIRVTKREEDATEKYKNDAKLNTQSNLFLLSEITERRQKAIASIEEMGSSALRLVYGSGYRLKFQTFDEKRSATGVSNFKMEIMIGSPQDGDELLTGLMGERGGGVVEIVAFALRIAALRWCGYDGPLLMDEAYKSMSDDEKIEAVAGFLRTVSDQMGRQIIFATHKLNVFGPLADHIIHVTKEEDGISKVATMSPNSVVNDNMSGSGSTTHERDNNGNQAEA